MEQQRQKRKEHPTKERPPIQDKKPKNMEESKPITPPKFRNDLVIKTKDGQNWQGWSDYSGDSGYSSQDYKPWELVWYAEFGAKGVFVAWRLGRIMRCTFTPPAGTTSHKIWEVLYDPRETQGCHGTPVGPMYGSMLAPFDAACEALRKAIHVPKVYHVPGNVDV